MNTVFLKEMLSFIYYILPFTILYIYKKLKPTCISSIDLLFFKGFTQVGAAKELNTPLDTLKARIRNCLNELRTLALD